MLGPRGNESEESTPLRDVFTGLSTPMEEDAIVPRVDLLSLDEEPLGPSRDNMRRVRKRKGGPKWVRKLTKMVESIIDEVPLGFGAQEIWKVIIEFDKNGGQFLNHEAKNKK